MTETFAFDADIQQMVNLIINAFDSNKEIFLREIFPNATDALHKIKGEFILHPEEFEERPNLLMKIIPDKISSTITI